VKCLSILFLPVESSKDERYLDDMPLFSGLGDGWHTEFLRVTRRAMHESHPHVRFFRSAFSLMTYARSAQADLVFIHSFSFVFQTLALRMTLPSTTRMVIQHHAEQAPGNRLKRFFARLAFHRAHGYLFSSKSIAQSFISAGLIDGTNRVHEIMEGSNRISPGSKSEARTALGIGDTRVFIWVGRLYAIKDPMTLLKAFTALSGSWRLYLIYSEDQLLDEVKQYIRSNGLTEKIILVGKQPYHAMEQWYRAADYYVSTSRSEGSGYALAEAMAAGCVPIVTRIPSFCYMTENGRSAYLFEAGDHLMLHRVLSGIDHSRYPEMSAEALAAFHTRLSFQAIQEKMKRIFEMVLNE
jgi:glycosyltransferase involved in cell wall biosynthesis